MPSKHIFFAEQITPIDRGIGISTVKLVGAETEAQTISNGVTTFPPGSSVELHTHNTEECIVILEGEAVCEVAGQRYLLKAYDATFVPAGITHRFINESDRTMRFLWTYGSIDVTRTYVETGVTVGQFAPFGSQH